MEVVRPVVHGRVKTVKTEYSEDELPLDPDFASVLLDWKRQISEETRLPGQNWSSPATSAGAPTTRLWPSRTTSDLLAFACGVSKVRSWDRRLVQWEEVFMMLFHSKMSSVTLVRS